MVDLLLPEVVARSIASGPGVEIFWSNWTPGGSIFRRLPHRLSAGDRSARQDRALAQGVGAVPGDAPRGALFLRTLSRQVPPRHFPSWTLSPDSEIVLLE